MFEKFVNALVCRADSGLVLERISRLQDLQDQARIAVGMFAYEEYRDAAVRYAQSGDIWTWQISRLNLRGQSIWSHAVVLFNVLASIITIERAGDLRIQSTALQPTSDTCSDKHWASSDMPVYLP